MRRYYTQVSFFSLSLQETMRADRDVQLVISFPLWAWSVFLRGGGGDWEVALRKHPPLMRPTQPEPICPCRRSRSVAPSGGRHAQRAAGAQLANTLSWRRNVLLSTVRGTSLSLDQSLWSTDVWFNSTNDRFDGDFQVPKVFTGGPKLKGAVSKEWKFSHYRWSTIHFWSFTAIKRRSVPLNNRIK